MQPTPHREADGPESDDGRAADRRQRRFLSLTVRRQDLLRPALVALAAYLVTVELVYLFGYEIPTFRSLPRRSPSSRRTSSSPRAVSWRCSSSRASAWYSH